MTKVKFEEDRDVLTIDFDAFWQEKDDDEDGLDNGSLGSLENSVFQFESEELSIVIAKFYVEFR